MGKIQKSQEYPAAFYVAIAKFLSAALFTGLETVAIDYMEENAAPNMPAMIITAYNPKTTSSIMPINLYMRFW